MGIAAKSVDLSILGTKVGRPESLDVAFTSTQSAELVYAVDAIDFNGSNSHIQYANNLFSDIDLDYESDNIYDKSITISFWIKPNMGANQTHQVLSIDDSIDTQTSLRLTSNASASVRFLFSHSYNSTNRNSFLVGFNTFYGQMNDTDWNHVVYSGRIVNTGSGETKTQRLRVNGIQRTPNNLNTFDQSIETTADSYFGRTVAGTDRFNGCLTEFFLDDQFYDLNTTSELRKFYSATGRPVNPPTTNKLVHLTGNATTWTNKGTTTLGTQTLTNITDCADSPSD